MKKTIVCKKLETQLENYTIENLKTDMYEFIYTINN